jgi:AcrR family transcriptional regulator
MNKKESMKQDIGKAAMACFLKYGLEKTTLEDIARAVGMNKSSLFYYYKNKEALFLEVAVKEGEEYLASLQAKTLKKKGVETRVMFYMRERYNYYKTILNLNHISTEMLKRLLPGFLALYESVMEKEVMFLTGLLKEGMKMNEIIKTDAVKLASSFITMSDSIKHYTEQKAILQKVPEIDYATGFSEIKFLLTLIFKGLKN